MFQRAWFLRGAARGFDSRGENARELARFLKQGADLLRLQQCAVGNQFEPVAAFIGLFFDDAQSRYKLSSRPRTASGTIIRADRRPASHELISNSASRHCPGKGVDQFHDAQRELLGSLFQFIFCHGALTRTIVNSEIRNPRSEIYLCPIYSVAIPNVSGMKDTRASPQSFITSASRAP